MAVGHHGDEGAVRRARQQLDRIALRDRGDIRGKCRRESRRAACRSRSRRNGSGASATPARVRHGRRRTDRTASAPRRSARARGRRTGRHSRPGSSLSRLGERAAPAVRRRRPSRWSSARRRASASASAATASRSAAPNRSIVSSTRPPQHWPRSGPSALSSRVDRRRRRRASSACASASAPHSSAPPPIVPVNAPSGAHDHAGADLARARALRLRQTSPARRRRARRSNRSMVGQTASDHQPRHRLHGAQDRLPASPARRAAPALPGLRLWIASAIAAEHRDRQHQRRLADRLGAVDRVLAVGAVPQRRRGNRPARRTRSGIL